MENATQALIIGAGVLIGVIILSMGVYLFNIFGAYAADTQNKIDENEIAQFNNQFMKYNGLTDLTIQDVITVKNYALEHNKKNTNYNYKTDHASANNEYIDVYYDDNNGPRILAFTQSDEELLTKALTKKFTCAVEWNSNTGKINKIYFKET